MSKKRFMTLEITERQVEALLAATSLAMVDNGYTLSIVYDSKTSKDMARALREIWPQLKETKETAFSE